MAQSAAKLVDHVLPEDVPLRQFVLTQPFELRARIAYDRELMGGVGRIFVGTVLGFYARKIRERGISGGQSGAFTVVQRTSPDLKCSPHDHTCKGRMNDAEIDSVGFNGRPRLKESEFAHKADMRPGSFGAPLFSRMPGEKYRVVGCIAPNARVSSAAHLSRYCLAPFVAVREEHPFHGTELGTTAPAAPAECPPVARFSLRAPHCQQV
jgi:hypothetical protein